MRIDINEFYRYISLLENKCYNQQQKIEELQKEVEKMESIHRINSYDIVRLEKENVKLKESMQWFVDRCDKGEVRSKRTYARFKELLTK